MPKIVVNIINEEPEENVTVVFPVTGGLDVSTTSDEVPRSRFFSPNTVLDTVTAAISDIQKDAAGFTHYVFDKGWMKTEPSIQLLFVEKKGLEAQLKAKDLEIERLRKRFEAQKLSSAKAREILLGVLDDGEEYDVDKPVLEMINDLVEKVETTESTDNFHSFTIINNYYGTSDKESNHA